MSAGAGLHFFFALFCKLGSIACRTLSIDSPQKKREGTRDLPAEFLNFASLNQKGGTVRQEALFSHHKIKIT
jgi:hypothetical protein